MSDESDGAPRPASQTEPAEDYGGDFVGFGLVGEPATFVGRLGDVGLDGSPVLLRLGDELVIQAADGAVLVDIEGRRRVVIGDDVRVPASWGRPPYHLEDHRRWVLAISR